MLASAATTTAANPEPSDRRKLRLKVLRGQSSVEPISVVNPKNLSSETHPAICAARSLRHTLYSRARFDQTVHRMRTEYSFHEALHPKILPDASSTQPRILH